MNPTPTPSSRRCEMNPRSKEARLTDTLVSSNRWQVLLLQHLFTPDIKTCLRKQIVGLSYFYHSQSILKQTVSSLKMFTLYIEEDTGGFNTIPAPFYLHGDRV